MPIWMPPKVEVFLGDYVAASARAHARIWESTTAWTHEE